MLMCGVHGGVHGGVHHTSAVVYVCNVVRHALTPSIDRRRVARVLGACATCYCVSSHIWVDVVV